MRRCALLLGMMLVGGTAAAGSALDEIASSVQLWDHIGGIGIPTTGALFDAPATSRQGLSGNLPMVSVMRPMNVSVTPEWPEPFEEVVATVSGKTSDPYLTLDDATVSRQGKDIVIDLQWSTYTPPLSIIAFNGQCCSAGYGVEQVHPTVPGTLALESYEVTRSLGAFEAGRYRIHVHSRGALEGEVQATFEVRQLPPTFFDLLQLGLW